MTQRAINGLYVYFVTTNTTFSHHFFDNPRKAEMLGSLIKQLCLENNFILFCYCILPNHIHLLVRRDGRITLSKLMNNIKGKFSRLMVAGRFWQPRFNFRIIEDDSRFVRTVEYIQYNYHKMELPAYYGQEPWVFINWSAIQRFW